MVKPYYEEAGIVIYHGDCREILPTLPKVDLVLTDPPYGIGVTKMTLGNRKGAPIFRGVLEWDSEAFEMRSIAESGDSAIIWGGNYFVLPPSRCWLVWDKGTGDNDFADCELAWTNLDSVVKKFFRSWVGANAKERSDVDRYHPTQKPVEVMAWALKLAPDTVRTVLDPFMGSGTTLIACKQAGLICTGIEREEKYCEVAANRLRQGVLWGIE